MGRSVLKGVAAGTTALAVPAGAKRPERGRSLVGRRVFLESGVDLDLPAGANRVGSPTAADALLLSADTSVPRGRLVSALKRGAPISFVGTGADDALVSLLYDVRPSKAADAATSSALEKPADLSVSFGVEYDRNAPASVAVAWPRGGAIDTHQYRTDSPSRSYVLSRIDGTFELGGATSTPTSGATTMAYTCPDAESGWDCLGRSHEEKDLNEHGQIEKFVWVAKAANETDPNRDYFSWKTKLSMTPGKALGRSDWMNDYVLRTMDFEDNWRSTAPRPRAGRAVIRSASASTSASRPPARRSTRASGGAGRRPTRTRTSRRPSTSLRRRPRTSST
jgi:hypothetical protein